MPSRAARIIAVAFGLLILLDHAPAAAQETPNVAARIESRRAEPPISEATAAAPRAAGPLAAGQQPDDRSQPSQSRSELDGGLNQTIEQWTRPEGITPALRAMLTLGILSLAPAVLLMTTCFVRIAIVLGILRQALGMQQLPPNQVMTAAAMFLTLLIMWPVWKQTYDEGVAPYTNHQIEADEAWRRGTEPIRRFMSAQIERTGNSADVWMLYKYLPESAPEPKSFSDVPIVVLLPAFMLSELKTAFLIGFQIFLPFVVIDLVVASVTVAMGMLMLPPALVSLPFKLLLFVLVDGWHLVVEMLMASFQR